MRIRSAMDPYERVLSCTVGSTASFGRQVRAPAVCPQNSVESPRTPPHSRRIVSCACAGPVGRAPTVAKELAESAALSSLASYSAARCTAQLLTRQALVRRAEAILFGLDQAYQPSGLPRVAPVVTFQLMECADDAIKALFAADGAGLKGKVSKKKALAQLLCDMVGAPMLSPEEAEAAGARVSTRLVNMGKEDAAAAKAEARAARGSDDAAVAAVLERVVGMLERRGAVYAGFLPEMSTPPPPPPAPTPRGIEGWEERAFVRRVMESGGSGGRAPRDPLATEYLVGRIRELEKRVEELESKVKDAEDDRKSEKEISIRRQVEAPEYCRKAAMSAEDAHIILELASRCGKRIHQAYVQMAETAFSRDAWEEDRANKSDWLDALRDVSHFRFLWAPSALRYWSGMEEVEENYTALRERLAAALDKPFTRVDLGSLLPGWEWQDPETGSWDGVPPGSGERV